MTIKNLLMLISRHPTPVYLHIQQGSDLSKTEKPQQAI